MIINEKNQFKACCILGPVILKKSFIFAELSFFHKLSIIISFSYPTSQGCLQNKIFVNYKYESLSRTIKKLYANIGDYFLYVYHLLVNCT